jgi:sialate O-acetylesterase
MGAFSASVGWADVRLPSIIGDNMVLQGGERVSLWGWSDPNEEINVRVSWRDGEWTVSADESGAWRFTMTTPDSAGPHEITLKGKNTVAIRNILIGEVWVCSGQSNMEWPLRSAANGLQEVAAADYPNIRLFTVQKKIATTPQDDCVGQWTECNPQTALGFSAVGYFFGRHLHQELKTPIGLINTSWGGTVAEAWTSAEALKKMTDFADRIEQIEQSQANANALENYRENLARWQKEVESAGAQGARCFEADFDDSNWQKMTLPTTWEQAGLANFDGLVWFRKTVEVPSDWAGKDLELNLGPIDDMDTTWVNGIKVGAHQEAGQYQALRLYKVSGKFVKAGRNVIAVQVLDTGGEGGICGQPALMTLKVVGAPSGTAIPLAGEWRYKVAFNLGTMPARPTPPAGMNNANAPTVLYNGMIAPITPYRIRGAIWYQGESNADRAYQYRELFPVMIKCWWDGWGERSFPFLFAQLANYMATKPQPGESAWAELREAQLMTLQLPGTGMATIIDIGQADDIHPRNKQDVGKRLALWALAKSYGKDIVYSGPLYQSMVVKDDAIVLRFLHADGGLVAQGGEPLKGFAIAGVDRKFVWAEARIEGDTVVVGSDQVPAPVAVRYAWADNPICNLYNGAGLPASPFRTDTWPGTTINNR